MATPSVPNRALIEAMEELGLLGWLPNKRWAVRARRVPIQSEETSSTQIALVPSMRLAPWLGVVGGAAVAASLLALGGSGIRESRETVTLGRALRTWGVAIGCGVGLVGAWMLIKIGGAGRRAR